MAKKGKEPAKKKEEDNIWEWEQKQICIRGLLTNKNWDVSQFEWLKRERNTPKMMIKLLSLISAVYVDESSYW